MGDGLIFPYRPCTDHADARVLTHAAGHETVRGSPSGVPGGL